jgi:DNA adenine methylase
MSVKVLKYPGSKWNIALRLADLVPPHHSYVEPFFGSGALLFNKPSSDIETINDLDSDVTNLFYCIQHDSERLARLVMTTPYSREIYEQQFFSYFSGHASRYQRAAGFLIQCWQGHGFRTTGREEAESALKDREIKLKDRIEL